jgi:beta-lactamase regulating signal transducer with metallopeptidase domain
MTGPVDIVLRSSLLLLLGLALMPLLRRQSAALRHWVLLTSLIGAAAVPAASWLLPTWEVVDVGAMLPVPMAESVTSLGEKSGQALQMRAFDPADALGAVPPSTSWADVIIRTWIAGAAVSFTLLVVGIAQLYRVHRTARPLAHGQWRDTAPAAVRVTDRPGLLVVWGFRKPTIIVPGSALRWTDDCVRAVLHHELAHVRRQDWLLLVAAEMVRAAYWFNPLVWIVCARLRTEAELACDDAVIVAGTPGPAYASHVVDIARELTAAHRLPAPALIRQSTLERRVRAMLDKTRNRRPLSSRASSTALVAMLAATLGVAAIAAQSFVSLSGTIVDPSQGLLPGVKLILVNEQSQAKYEIQTDRTGRYEFVGLPPGDYTMTAALPGFSQFSARVTVGTQSLQHDLTMSVGTIRKRSTSLRMWSRRHRTPSASAGLLKSARSEPLNSASRARTLRATLGLAAISVCPSSCVTSGLSTRRPCMAPRARLCSKPRS